jgi:uncharacterized protein YbaP (TraB family)
MPGSTAYRRVVFTLLMVVAPGLAEGEAQLACPPPLSKPTPAQLQEEVRRRRDRGALWRFEKDGRHGYLYGTIHLGKLEWLVLGPLVMQALLESEVVALELIPNSATGAELQSQTSLLRNTTVLPASLLDRVLRLAAKACVSWEWLQANSPTGILMTLAQLDWRWRGLYVELASEVFLDWHARHTAKEMVSLETIAIQRDALMGWAPDNSLASAERRVSAIESGKNQRVTERAAEAWAAGDLSRLENVSAWCECDDDADARVFLERAIVARNPGLASRIEEVHRGGKRVFAAIGALHTVGDQSVPRLLAARGFTVERLAYPAPDRAPSGQPLPDVPIPP